MGKGHLSMHRKRAKGEGIRTRHESEQKSVIFQKRDEPDKVLKRVNLPYTSQIRTFNHGLLVSRKEHLKLYELYYDPRNAELFRSSDIRKAKSLPSVEAFYKVRYSPARHKLLQNFDPAFDGLAIHPRKFLRDCARYFLAPPPNMGESKRSRETYTLRVRDYVKIKKTGKTILGVRKPIVVETAILHEEWRPLPLVACDTRDHRVVEHEVILEDFEWPTEWGWQVDSPADITHDPILINSVLEEHSLPALPTSIPPGEHHRVLELFVDVFVHGYNCENWVECNNEFVRRMDLLSITLFELLSALNGNNGSWTNSDDVDNNIDDALLQLRNAGAFDNANVREIRGENNAARNRRNLNRLRHARGSGSESGSERGRANAPRHGPPAFVPPPPPVALAPIPEAPAPEPRLALPMPSVQSVLYSQKTTEPRSYFPIRLLYCVIVLVVGTLMGEPLVYLLLVIPILAYFAQILFRYFYRFIREIAQGFPGNHTHALYEELDSYDPSSESYLADLGYNASFRGHVYLGILASLHAQYSRARVDNAATQSAMLDWCHRECERKRETDKIDYLPLNLCIVTNTVLKATTDILVERRRLEVHTRPKYGMEVLGW